MSQQQQQQNNTETNNEYDENIFINQIDGLTNQHPSLPDTDSDNYDIDADTFDDLPTSIIVTNIHSEVFTNDELKSDMENLFKIFSKTVTFQWLKSFRRLRVNFDSAIAAASARLQLHQYPFGKSLITCYFAQPVTPVSHKNLQLPAPFKQFLISPPASPPAGWEPRAENEPLVNHDLLAALANLTPGESHELHPPTTEHPAIIVHTAVLSSTTTTNSMEDDNDDDDGDGSTSPIGAGITTRPRIQQTKCPERTTS